jgi:O-antigen/teichoic acid export membrane protein
MVAGDASKKELTELFTRIGRVQFLVLSLICSGIIMFGRSFIILWAGKNYSGAYPMVLLLIIPVTIPLIQNLGIEIQRAKNMHKFRSWVYLFIAFGNVAISIILARRYGGLGAAAGTGIALFIGNGLVMNWYNHKKIGLDIIYFWKQILKFTPAFIAPVLFGVSANYFFNLSYVFPLLMCIIAYTIIFAISMWFLGMNPYEKALIGEPVSRLLKRLKPHRA